MTTISKLPHEIIPYICYLLSDRQILNMKEVCGDYLKVINTDKKLQTQIAYRFLLDHQQIAGIPLDSIQYFLQHDRLVVDIKDDLSILGATNRLTPAFPWITHLIVRKGSASSLQDLFKLVHASKQITTLFLLDCELDKTHLSDLSCKKLDLYFCNTKTPDGADFSEEKTVKIEDAQEVIEDILGEETDSGSLNEFQQKVIDQDASSDEVLKAFDSMKSSSRAKVISGIWYAAIMDPRETLKKSIREIQRLAREYIEKNPHHPAVLSAVSSSTS